MGKLKQFETLVIHQFESSQFHLPFHGHTYYELIYILKGKGEHYINANCIPYLAGDLFALAPGDEHYFEIKESTHFAFIKFTESYFNSRKHFINDKAAPLNPEAYMKRRFLKEFKLIFDEPYHTILRSTVENILAYDCVKNVATSPLIYYQIVSIFGLIKEVIIKQGIAGDNSLPDNNELISYVNQHIYEPQKILIKNLAASFNIADNYFSAYFKRNFGISYREYINNYRIKLIEQRIAAGQLTLKQIAAEFGFVDESHLSNYFKTQTNINPKTYRSNYVVK
jgi:AraC-like DNA-binding protein